MELRNRRVLITGASRGIGAALARAFAEADAKVILAARSEEAISELAGELEGEAYAIDLADQERVDGFIASVEREGGPIDVLVNNAGMETHDLIDDANEADIVGAISLNLMTPQRLTCQVLPGMIARGQGHIVTVSSMVGLVNVPATSVYSSTKAGLSHFSGGLRADLKGTPIGLTLVEPGPVNTNMWDAITASPPIQAAVHRANKLQLLPQIEPEKLAKAVVTAVAKDRYHVRTPRRGLPLYILEDLPRRIMAACLTGVDNRP